MAADLLTRSLAPPAATDRPGSAPPAVAPRPLPATVPVVYHGGSTERDRHTVHDATLAHSLEELHDASFSWALSCCSFDRDEAQEVLQTTYLKIVDGRARFDGRSQLKTWLFAVIRRTAADRRRRGWLRRLGLHRWGVAAVAPEAPADPEGQTAQDETRTRVLAALGELSPRQREMVELVFYHDLTIEEAAQVMGVSLGTGRTHYERGKRRLLELLSEGAQS